MAAVAAPSAHRPYHIHRDWDRMSESPAALDRRKWNARYREGAAAALPARPEPHPLTVRWRSRFTGGAMLDAACGLGRGLAGALGTFAPCYAVDVSDVAICTARRAFPDVPVRWIVADVTALPWPENAFGLVCSFGFTDQAFLRRMRLSIRPGGMLLYEGFSRRQLEERPAMNPDWTLDLAQLRGLLAGWLLLEIGESAAPPYLLRCVALRASGS